MLTFELAPDNANILSLSYTFAKPLSSENGKSWASNVSLSTHDPEAADNLDGKRQLLPATVRAIGQPGTDDPVMRVEQLEQSHFFVPENGEARIQSKAGGSKSGEESKAIQAPTPFYSPTL